MNRKLSTALTTATVSLFAVAASAPLASAQTPPTYPIPCPPGKAFHKDTQKCEAFSLLVGTDKRGRKVFKNNIPGNPRFGQHFTVRHKRGHTYHVYKGPTWIKVH